MVLKYLILKELDEAGSIVVISFYRWGNWITEKLNDLSIIIIIFVCVYLYIYTHTYIQLGTEPWTEPKGYESAFAPWPSNTVEYK